jgi:hypothetical protein
MTLKTSLRVALAAVCFSAAGTAQAQPATQPAKVMKLADVRVKEDLSQTGTEPKRLFHGSEPT